MLGPYSLKRKRTNYETGTTKLEGFLGQEEKLCCREFHVGDHVYIKVKPNKSTLRLEKYNKFAPRYGKAFKIQAKVGSFAYQLALPPNIKVHNVFYVS